MKFRAKIWAMPASAALLFTAGLGISLLLGSEVSNSIRLLRHVDEPYLTQILRIDRAAELVQGIVQSATSEGDVAKLDDVTSPVIAAHQGLAAIEALEGKHGSSTALGEAFGAYEVAAVNAAKAMLSKSADDNSAEVTAMQSTSARFNKILLNQIDTARRNIDTRYDTASSSSHRVMLVMLLTGLSVLSMLGVASWIIVKSVWRELGDDPERLCEQVRRIASGELSAKSQVGRADLDSVDGALSGMTGGLRSMIADIREVANSIQVASSEIAAGNQDLSERTDQTASSLQYAANAMEELTVTVRQTAASAGAANNLASAAMQAAQRGGSVVSEVVANMMEIDSSSRRITEIIGVIDGIAFQTNILALNAAVEAARAGEQGRGFAVVASEVRTLAHRSATAAKEIKVLILNSSEKIESGTRLVKNAGATMCEVVTSVRQVNELIGEIALASGEQSTGIVAVTKTVNEIDRMTQSNAALVEESAAAAASLSLQTGRLSDSVSRFRLGGPEHEVQHRVG